MSTEEVNQDQNLKIGFKPEEEIQEAEEQQVSRFQVNDRQGTAGSALAAPAPRRALESGHLPGRPVSPCFLP